MYHKGPHCGASQCDMKHHQHEVLQQIAMVLRGQHVRLFRQKSKTLKSQPPTNIQKLTRRICLVLIPFCELILVEQIFFPKEHYAQSLSNSIRGSMITMHLFLLLLLNLLHQRSNQQFSTNRRGSICCDSHGTRSCSTTSTKMSAEWTHICIAHSHPPHPSLQTVLLQSMNERC